MKLTEKQKRFCDYYIETANATESAIRAGYSKKTAKVIGAENLSKPYLRSHIDEKLKGLEDNRISDAMEVMKYLSNVMRGEEKEEVVVTENIGDYMSRARIIEKQVSAKERIKAAELLGKRYSLFTDRMDINANVGVTIIDDIEVDDDES